MKQIRIATAFALLLFPLGLTRLARAAEVPAVGQQAPDFTLPSQDGTPTSLKSFHGKWTVLYFYPKDMTQGCTIEAHNFQQDLAKYQQHNAVIVGVSVDTTDSHKEFCAKESLTFKLLADTDKKVVDEYGSLGTRGVASRNTFLIDPSGKIVKVWTGVNPTHHSEEVLAALDANHKM
ncbi:MAG TPA: peroxiredoxin [Bryobacteraceae bacterium]|nr:peroxiredoxin [Bryobacteraceae bacterium]